MANLTKQTLRKLFKIKREELVNSKGSSLTIQLQTQLLLQLPKILRNHKINIELIGSYLPNKGKEISPPILQHYSYSFPWFQKKQKGGLTPLMQFKKIENHCQSLQKIYGIQIPSKQLVTVIPDIVFVPLTCFHPQSRHRIGYGGGFYDLYIESMRKRNFPPVFIGIGAQSLKTEEQFWNEKDQALDYIITETHLY